MNDLEKIAEKIKELAYQSKKFTWAIIAFLVLITTEKGLLLGRQRKDGILN